MRPDETLRCGLSPQEDSEDGERRPSEELLSEAEPATEDGEERSQMSMQLRELFN